MGPTKFFKRYWKFVNNTWTSVLVEVKKEQL
jgi:hypothetical protein